MKSDFLIFHKEGFTLIEVMITMVVLSIGLVALAGIQISAIKGNAFSRRMTTAVSVAEQTIEQIKNSPYDNVQSQSTTQVTAANMNFNSQVNVTNTTPTNGKRVEVTVSWSDSGKSHDVRLSTIISPP